MSVERIEIGMVSGDAALVAFYRDVFQLRELEPRATPAGTVHRLGDDEAVLKVLVPAVAPAPPAPSKAQFWDAAGLRYFTAWVDDLDAIARRCADHGGTVAFRPVELRPGVRTMVVHDPDGNVVEVMEQRA